MDKIIIPNDILKICQYFDDKANLKEGVDEDFDNIKQAISKNKEEIKQSIYKTINSSKIKPYLEDMRKLFKKKEDCL